MERTAHAVEEVWMPTWTTLSLFLLAALGLLFIPGHRLICHDAQCGSRKTKKSL